MDPRRGSHRGRELGGGEAERGGRSCAPQRRTQDQAPSAPGARTPAPTTAQRSNAPTDAQAGSWRVDAAHAWPPKSGLTTPHEPPQEHQAPTPKQRRADCANASRRPGRRHPRPPLLAPRQPPTTTPRGNPPPKPPPCPAPPAPPPKTNPTPKAPRPAQPSALARPRSSATAPWAMKTARSPTARPCPTLSPKTAPTTSGGRLRQAPRSKLRPTRLPCSPPPNVAEVHPPAPPTFG